MIVPPASASDGPPPAMDRERWARLEALCDAAAHVAPGERDAFLARATDDAGLQSEARQLLAWLDRDRAFLERPVIELAAAAADADLPLPASVGPHRVLRSIGRGGMGEVYQAVRVVDGVEQLVAIKVVRSVIAAPDLVRRFRLERRILASLDHPNIARLLDAGTTEDGRPYFVMEYVDGTPITEYCAARRLGVRARLELFQTVCAAVQHAHQKLVVHRDLKPRNILVTADGAAKLLDFGIGKTLTDDGPLGPREETRTGLRLLTPEYAAPEQLLGEPATTATDVYGLGLLLYELLAGRHAYLTGHETLAQIEEAVRSAVPMRPSLAAPADGRQLAGDLDNIVLLALRKEPLRRYPSAAALGEDVRRHLVGLPVVARPDTIRYRTAKFVRRNLAAVAAVAIAFLGLATATTVTLVQSRRVARQAERIARERDKALEVRGFLLEMFGATGADAAVGDTVTARRLLDLQASRLDAAYQTRPELRAEMMEVLSDGYDRLGLARDAEPLATAALALRRKVLRPGHPDLAASLNQAGWLTHQLGRSTEAEPLLREAVSIRRRAGPGARRDLSRSLNDLGVVLTATRDYAGADSALTEALDIRMEELGPEDRAVGITANNLAAVHYFENRLDDAIRVQGVALTALRASVGEAHQRTVVALNNLAAFKRAQGDVAAAEKDYEELLALQTRLQGPDHPVTARVRISVALHQAERALHTGDRVLLDTALDQYRQALAAFEHRLGPAHPQTGSTLERIAHILSEQGRHAEALDAAERAVEILRAAHGDGHAATIAARARLAGVEWRAGRRARALTRQRDVVTAYEAQPAAAAAEAALARGTLCGFLLAEGAERAAEAEGLCETAALALARGPATASRHIPLMHIRLALAHLAQGRRTAAESLAARVEPSLGGLGLPARRAFDSLRAALGRPASTAATAAESRR